jgi:His-Xaa-Ser system radical SAM maturase HxsC
MIPLRGCSAVCELARPLPRSLWLLVDRPTPLVSREAQAFLIGNGAEADEDYKLYIGKNGVEKPAFAGNYIELPSELSYLQAGDIVSLSPEGRQVRVLWRSASDQNSVLLTERCDHYCLMCSQPPRNVDDAWLLEEAMDLVRLLPRTTRGIGFTGGEPTLYGEKLFELLRLCRNLLPETAVHVLSNGRRFSDFAFARSYAAIENPNLLIGIPIYGSEPSRHNYVVQSQGAFEATVRGILNLAQLGQRVELRVVVHKQTAPVLRDIAEFVARNLPFVEHVALMGLEMIGFARANMDEIWIDPVDYKQELTEATLLLDRLGIRVLIYNHQLCLIDRQIWPFAVKSISDWKNEYHSECLRCRVRDTCGGFFYSAKYRMSDHIQAIRDEELSPAMLAVGN